MSIDRQDDWTGEGISPDRRRQWEAAGVTGPDDAAHLTANGVTPDMAAQALGAAHRVGVISPSHIKSVLRPFKLEGEFEREKQH